MLSFDMQPKTVIVMGSQGSGKGTQVNLLVKYLQEHDSDNEVFHHDTGRCFREFMEEEGYTNELVKASIDRGELQPDFLPIRLWANDFVKNLTESTHVIVDGSPRTMTQAHVLDSAMQFYKRSDIHVIILEVDTETSVARLLARGRTDDTEEAIRKRLAWSEEQVLPLADFFEEHPNYTVSRIDGVQPIEGVHKDVLRAIGIES